MENTKLIIISVTILLITLITLFWVISIYRKQKEDCNCAV
jgi:nitrogen fixation-related uncharacterized protein